MKILQIYLDCYTIEYYDQQEQTKNYKEGDVLEIQQDYIARGQIGEIVGAFNTVACRMNQKSGCKELVQYSGITQPKDPARLWGFIYIVPVIRLANPTDLAELKDEILNALLQPAAEWSYHLANATDQSNPNRYFRITFNNDKNF